MTAERIGPRPSGSGVSRQVSLDTRPAAPDTRGERSATELEAAMLRLLRALDRRAAAGDDEAAVALIHLAAASRRLANAALVGAHRFGYSYADLGAFLGVSRQAVAERVARASRG